MSHLVGVRVRAGVGVKVGVKGYGDVAQVGPDEEELVAVAGALHELDERLVELARHACLGVGVGVRVGV